MGYRRGQAPFEVEPEPWPVPGFRLLLDLLESWPSRKRRRRRVVEAIDEVGRGVDAIEWHFPDRPPPFSP